MIDDKKGLVIYRVLQESLNNIVKYVKDSQIDIVLDIDGRRAKLLVKDDGSGFDFNRVDKDNCFGIRGMKERVEEVDGEYIIESVVGRGTSVSVEVPM